MATQMLLTSRLDEKALLGRSQDELLHLARVLQLSAELSAALSEQAQDDVEYLEGQVKQLQLDFASSQVALGGDEALKQLNEANRELEDMYRRLDESERERERLVEEVEGLQSAPSNLEQLRLQGELDQAREENARLGRRLAIAEEDAERERERASKHEMELAEKTQRLEDVHAALKHKTQDMEELRAMVQAEQRRAELSDQGKSGDRNKLKAKNRELDRMLRENKLLEKANEDLRSAKFKCAEEVAQLSETTVVLDARVRDAEEVAATLNASKRELERKMDALREHAATLELKLEERDALLTTFERKFASQCAEWQARESQLVSEVESLRQPPTEPDRSARSTSRLVAEEPRSSAGADIAPAGHASVLNGAGNLASALRDARSKEVLLLEAYEQLERDTKAEVCDALAEQDDELNALRGDVQRLEQQLKAERQRFVQLDEALAAAQGDADEARSQLGAYESGVYGLPDAMRGLKMLKRQLRSVEDELGATVRALNQRGEQMEDLLEENRMLRQRAGLPEEEALDVTGFRAASQVELEQLRALCRQLEKEVGLLEDERRALKVELRFRAKWQGMEAARLGLSATQLQLLDEYADSLRHEHHGERDGEALSVETLERQVHVLQDRLRDAERVTREEFTREAATRVRELEISLATAEAEKVAALEKLSAIAAEADSQTQANAALRDAIFSKLAAIEKAQRATELQKASDICSQGGAQDTGAEEKDAYAPDAMSSELASVLQALRLDVQACATAPADKSAEASQHTHTDRQLASDMSALREELQGLRKALVSSVGQQGNARLSAAASGAQGTTIPLQAPISLAPDETSERATAGLTPDGQMASVRLVEALAELARREEQLEAISAEMEAYRTSWEHLQDQHRLLYAEYVRRRKEWKAEEASLQERARAAESAQMVATERAETAQRLIHALDGRSGADDDGESALKNAAADAVQQLILAQTRNAQLNQALAATQSSERRAQRALTASKSKIDALEELDRRRTEMVDDKVATATLQVTQLQALLANSVPRKCADALEEDVRVAAKQNRELSVALGELVTRQAVSEGATALAEDLQRDLAAAREERSQAEDHVVALKAAMACASGSESDSGLASEEMVALRMSEAASMRRCRTLEAEAEASDHRGEQLRLQVKELEKQARELSKALRDATVRQGELEEALSSSVTQDEAKALREEVMQLQCGLALAREGSSLTQMARDAAPVDGTAKSTNATASSLDVCVATAGNPQPPAQLASSAPHTQQPTAERTRLRQELSETRAALFRANTTARKADDARRRAQQRLEVALAGSVPLSKAQAWARSLKKMQSYAQKLSARVAELSEQASLATEARRASDQACQAALDRLPTTASSCDAPSGRDTKQVVFTSFTTALRSDQRETLDERLEAKRVVRQVEELKAQLEDATNARASAQQALAIADEATMKATLQLEMTQAELADARQAAADERAYRALLPNAPATLEHEQSTQRSLTTAATMGASMGLQSQLLDVYVAPPKSILEKLTPASTTRQDVQTTVPLVVGHASGDVAGTASTASLLASDAANAANFGISQALDRKVVPLSSPSSSVADVPSTVRDFPASGGADTRPMPLAQAVRLMKLQGEAGALARQLVASEEARLQLRAERDFANEKVVEMRGLIARMESAPDYNVPSSIVENGAQAEDVAIVRVSEVAQVTIERLRASLDEKTRQVDEYRSAVRTAHARALEIQEVDRREIRRLQDELQQAGARCVSGMRLALQQPVVPAAGPRDSGAQVPGHLIAVLGERESQIEVLNVKLEALRCQCESSEAALQERISTKAAELEACRREVEIERSRGPSRAMESLVQRLRLQLASKDRKLGQLKVAVGDLKNKLVNEMKRQADVTIEKSNERTSDDALAQFARMQSQLKTYQRRLASAQESQRNAKAAEEALFAEAEQLRATLAKEREAVHKASLGSPAISPMPRRVGAASGPEAQSALGSARARIVELEQRVKALVAANADLESTNTKGHPRSASALAHWEENKRAARRIESLRAKLVVARREAAEAKEEFGRCQRNAMSLTRERDALLLRVGAGHAASVSGKRGARHAQEVTKLRVMEDECRRLEHDLSRAKKRAHVQDVADVIAATEVEKLRGELELARRISGGTPSAMSEALAAGERVRDELRAALVAKDAELAELRVERDAIATQCASLRSRMDILFDEATQSMAGRGSVPLTRAIAPADVESVVAALKAVIEKLRADNESLRRGAASATKYMHAVKSAKELRGKFQALRAEHDKLVHERESDRRNHIQIIERMERSTDELRKQFINARTNTTEVGTQTPISTTPAGEAEQAAVTRLAAAARVAADEAKRLQAHCVELEAERAALKREVALAKTAGKPSEKSGGNAAGELHSLRLTNAALKKERDALRDELSAFTPEFFEELEDLKYIAFESRNVN